MVERVKRNINKQAEYEVSATFKKKKKKNKNQQTCFSDISGKIFPLYEQYCIHYHSYSRNRIKDAGKNGEPILGQKTKIVQIYLPSDTKS